MANYRVISSDNHVFEPPDLWTDPLGPFVKVLPIKRGMNSADSSPKPPRRGMLMSSRLSYRRPTSWPTTVAPSRPGASGCSSWFAEATDCLLKSSRGYRGFAAADFVASPR